MGMDFEWDEAKRRSNLEKHGVDFVDAVQVLVYAQLIWEDMRRDYKEQRFIAMGDMYSLLFVVAFTIRDGAFRIISARRANARERSYYAERTTQEVVDPYDPA